MNENELKFLWQSASEKLQNSLKINKKNTNEITKLNVQNVLSTMKPKKVFLIIFGVIWVIALASLLSNLLINHLQEASLFFMFSVAILLLLNVFAIAVYIYQIDLINKIDYSEPVLIIQKKISILKISTLNVARILFLQLPVWTIFYWNEKMFVAENWVFVAIQVMVALSFTYFALWLFFNIKYENKNKKWFQLIFRGKEWQPILQSIEFLNQIEEYQENGDERYFY